MTVDAIIDDNNNLEEKLQIQKLLIGEDEKLKQQCLSQLREWISQNRDIEFVLTDDIFLLRFLRSKKYSLFAAQQMILKYMNFRRIFGHYAPDMDYLKHPTEEIFDAGFVYASPIRDSEGRRVIFYHMDAFDTQKYTKGDFAKMYAVTYEAVMEDEETQLLGVNHVIDAARMSLAFSTLFSISEYARLISWGEQSIPMSHKQINVLHLPSALKFLYEYATGTMSKKLRDRVIVHSSNSLLDHVDSKCLPKEMGGIMPKSEMIKLWKEELKQKRERLLTFEKINLLSDQGIIRRKNIAEHMKNAEIQGMCGSFRKLEVD